MHVVARFSGIVIRMLYLRGMGARLHAFYGEGEMVVELATLRILQVDVPPHVSRLVLAWAARHQRELLGDRRKPALRVPARGIGPRGLAFAA